GVRMGAPGRQARSALARVAGAVRGREIARAASVVHRRRRRHRRLGGADDRSPPPPSGARPMTSTSQSGRIGGLVGWLLVSFAAAAIGAVASANAGEARKSTR